MAILCPQERQLRQRPLTSAQYRGERAELAEVLDGADFAVAVALYAIPQHLPRRLLDHRPAFVSSTD